MSKDTSGPAFPQDIGWVSPNQHVQYRGPQGGMTLRDYFAAKALPAIYKDVCEFAGRHGWPDDWRNEVANESYEMADAMLKAREA